MSPGVNTWLREKVKQAEEAKEAEEVKVSVTCR